MRPKEERKLINEVALACGVPPSLVAHIIDHALEFIAATIKKGKFQGVKLPGFGSFWVSTYRLKHINELVSRGGRKGSNRLEHKTDTRIQAFD